MNTLWEREWSSMKKTWRTTLATWCQEKDANTTKNSQKEAVAQGHVSAQAPDHLQQQRSACLQSHSFFHIVLCWVLSASSEERLTSDCLVHKVGSVWAGQQKATNSVYCTILLLKAALINVETLKMCKFFICKHLYNTVKILW